MKKDYSQAYCHECYVDVSLDGICEDCQKCKPGCCQCNREEKTKFTLTRYTKDEINSIWREGPFWIRLTRLLDQPVIEYEGWSYLSIQRKGNDIIWENNDITLITPNGPNTPAWADASIDDIADNGNIIVEDYMMEIFHRSDIND